VMNLDMGELHWILRVEMTYDHVVLPSSWWHLQPDLCLPYTNQMDGYTDGLCVKGDCGRAHVDMSSWACCQSVVLMHSQEKCQTPWEIHDTDTQMKKSSFAMSCHAIMLL
jgi:hypothetical protein